MASTEKVSLSLDSGSLLLARRAAQLEGLSLSAYLSRLVRRHAWASEQPAQTMEQREAADARTVALDEQEEQMWDDEGGQRAAG